MKPQLFKSCFVAAALSLFYACTPDEQVTAELDAISQSEESSGMVCDEITFENNVTRDASGFVSSVQSTGGKTIGVMGVRRSSVYPVPTYETVNSANLFNTTGTTRPDHSDDDDLMQAETGNVLIVNQTSTATYTDDFARGAKMIVDFSSLGNITLTSMTVLDNEETASKAILYLQNGTTQTFEYPMTGDGGVGTLMFGTNGTSDVVKLEVILGNEKAWVGSGAIDNIKFCYGTSVSGCTRTQGYWKNHASDSKHYDATWAKVGEGTAFFKSNQTYYSILGVQPKGNAYYILAHQYVAATLNMKVASAPNAVMTAYNQATTFFNTYTPAQVAGDKSLHSKATQLAGILDDYNNGKTGPGHCD